MSPRVPALLLAVTLLGTSAVAAANPSPDEAVARAPGPEDVVATLAAAARETEPVVLTGDAFAGWAVPADVAVKANSVEGLQCLAEGEGFPPGAPDTPVTDDEPCSHNTYEQPDASTQDVAGLSGTPVDRLIGYRWNPTGGFEQVPFQVDEVFVRYLSNNNSGFAMYSETDQHTTYAFDREGFRWTDQDPADACLARPASPVATDPVAGLDSDDELVFLARDTGTRAPTSAQLPDGIEDVREVAVTDPLSGTQSYLYVALAAENGPRPAFDATNGYVSYERDADADVFRFSESSYDNYGAAPHGAYRDEQTGECIGEDDPSLHRQRRPGDQATITTPRYRFRYEGRWLMTQLQVDPTDEGAAIAPDGSEAYADDLVDQWKARAFQQRPGGETPCCGYEEEVNNWGGSSQLLGELAGPVRVVRETWGADSGTNVVRRETFYRDEVQQTSFLRVHVIPPLDGIYVQWDHNALAVDTYRNPYVPDGVAIDGRNDEVFGNSRIYLGPDGVGYGGDDTLSDAFEDVIAGTPLEPVLDPEKGSCSDCVYNDIDSPDPTLSGPNGLLAWEQVSGPTATIVSRWGTQPSDTTAGGVAHAPLVVPYYRDDACFDDGTGSDPGPHLIGRKVDPDTWTDADGNVQPRTCWTPEDGAEHLGHERYYQGSIGTHGLHILAIADSDNAHLTIPITEMISTQRMVLLPGDQGNVGERYGRGFEKPLVTRVGPAAFVPSEAPASGTWLAGDLHIHTTYSHDSYGGPDDDEPDISEEPTEVYTLGNTVAEQFAVAGARGLDFLAITDHNDVRSQTDPGFGTSGVVGVPGYEKSLSGHAQMLGADHLYDKGDGSAAAVRSIADELRAAGGVFQINHPTDGYTHRDPDGVEHEHLDWGYGTDVVPDTMEVWNIGAFWQPPAPSASSLDDALRFWEEFLDAGHQVGATGGSDNHFKATLAAQGPGQPTTWVLSDDRTAGGVLEGLRAGHTFVSWQPPNHAGPKVFLEADADRSGDFESPAGSEVLPTADLRVRVQGAPVGSVVRLFVDGGQRYTAQVVESPDGVVSFPTPTGATWIRAELVLDGAIVGDEPPYEPLTTVCDEQLGDNPVHEDGDTTYCRNQIGLLALTSPIYLAAPDGEVEPAATTLTWVGDEAGKGDTIQAAARLTDADGGLVAGRTVTFEAQDSVAEAVTGTDGVARATLATPDHGRSVTVTSRFAGDAAYEPSQITTEVVWGGPPGDRGPGSGPPGGGSAPAASGPTTPGSTAVSAAAPAAGLGLVLALVLVATALRRRQQTTVSGGLLR
ncbi:MAG TPA: CehA/McbA family metallohydrolase [Nitriliruptorales bacterium]